MIIVNVGCCSSPRSASDSCTKNAFCFNRIIRKQEDGVLMGSSLGPVHANIIMTELESESYRIVEPLITSGKIKFYIQNVDDTLLLLPIMGDRDCCVCL